MTGHQRDVVDETKCVLCQLFPEQQAEHQRLHHKLDIQNDQLVELPIEPPPDDETSRSDEE